MLEAAEHFFSGIRADLFHNHLSEPQVQGIDAILSAMDGTLLSHCAYGLATAYHETNQTMQPVREAYWFSEAWRKKNLRYWPWYGRGFVQLTWEKNYEQADLALGLHDSLIANPDRAMEPDIAARIMRQGMEEGWFTHHTLSQHCPERLATVDQYEEARGIINGTDRAHLIAGYAMEFQQALEAGGWT